MKKKDPNEDEFNHDDQDNINEADDSFGLPDVDFNTLDEESEEGEKAEEEVEEEVAEVETTVTEDVEEEESEEIGAVEEDVDSEENYSNTEEELVDADEGDGEANEEVGTTRSYVPPKPESNAPKLIVALLVTLVVSIGIWYFAFYRPQVAAEEKARMEQVRKDEAAKRAAAIKADNERKAAEAARAANASGIASSSDDIKLIMTCVSYI